MKYIIYNILTIISIIFTQSALVIPKCIDINILTSSKDNFYSLSSFTNLIDNYCNINSEFQKYKEIFDDYTIKRRIIRIEYTKNHSNTHLEAINTLINSHFPLNISIKATILKGKGTVKISKNNFLVSQNEKIDTFITYICSPNNIQYNIIMKINFNIYINDQSVIDFNINKICHNEKNESIDLSNIVLICICLLIIYTSTTGKLHSNIEDYFINQIPELRNTLNLFIILIIIFIIIICMDIINIFYIWNLFASFIMIPTSIAMFLELICDSVKIIELLPEFLNRKIYIKSVKIYYILFLTIGVCLFLLYFFYPSWILCDIISFCYCVTYIRCFKFTSFKSLIMTSFIVWLYDIFWAINYSEKYDSFSRLSFNSIVYNNYLPLLNIKIPEFNFPYTEEYIYFSLNDIIFTGFIINYLIIVDKCIIFSNRFYYLLSFCCFGISLFVIIYINYFLKHPIPGFCIIFPCICIPVIVASIYNGNFWDIVKGSPETVFAEREINSEKLGLIANYAYEQSNASFSSSVEMKYI